MFQQERELLRQELSGAAAMALVARIAQWHRIQASPMYREAATWLHSTLQGWGLEAELESFPVAAGTRVWGEALFDEWSCEEGTLDLLLPEGTKRLADYRAVPLSLLPRSCSVNGEFELVAVEGGDRIEEYAGLDVQGKLVLTKASPLAAHAVAVERLGAAGLIFDGMRAIATICPPGDLPDAIQYASFWWYGDERPAFGFALSPRAGAELRRLQQRALQESTPLRLRACVRSSLAPGAIEAVSARIPGESDEEVLLLAHLCHPAPCANDNASGAAAAMELARAIHSLISAGKLPRPRRAIRVLWAPEMTGTYLYLARHEARIAHTVAGLNMDMVGADQAQTGSVSMIVHPCEALPSFAAQLLEALREQSHGPAHTFQGRADTPLYRRGSAPFSNGSDHYILSDPSVGVPTPGMVEWPDRFYHTTADTLDKLSPATLERNMALAGAYLWFVANAGPRETAWLGRELNARLIRRVARESQSAVTAAMAGQPSRGAPWAERMAYRAERQRADLGSLRRLDPSFNPEPLARAAAAQLELLWAQTAELLGDWHGSDLPGLDAAEAALIPRRLVRGPVGLRALLMALPRAERAALDEEIRAARGLDSLSADMALAWADGNRTLGEILDLVELEADVRRPDALLAHFRLLARLGLVELATERGAARR